MSIVVDCDCNCRFDAKILTNKSVVVSQLFPVGATRVVADGVIFSLPDEGGGSTLGDELVRKRILAPVYSEGLPLFW